MLLLYKNILVIITSLYFLTFNLDAVLHNKQLSKISLTIQSKFNVPNFNAVSLYIITFDKMHEINLEKVFFLVFKNNKIFLQKILLNFLN